MKLLVLTFSALVLFLVGVILSRFQHPLFGQVFTLGLLGVNMAMLIAACRKHSR